MLVNTKNYPDFIELIKEINKLIFKYSTYGIKVKYNIYIKDKNFMGILNLQYEKIIDIQNNN